MLNFDCDGDGRGVGAGKQTLIEKIPPTYTLLVLKGMSFTFYGPNLFLSIYRMITIQ